jgi:HEAT repeat protein
MALFGPPDVVKLKARGKVEPLVRAARYKKDPAVRESARKVLEGMLDYLIGQLSTKNISHLTQVREALKLVGKPAVGKMIFVHTDHQSVQRRQDVTFVLGEMGDPEAVPVLITALRDPDALLRRLAADALGKLGDARAERPLRVALKDDNAIVAKSAAKALRRLTG